MSYAWMKLDTAANMYAVLHTKEASRIGCMFCVLKDEDVNPVVLKQAVLDILPSYEGFRYRVRKGFFWGYLEKTELPPVVCAEFETPGKLHAFGKTGRPEFRVTYYKRRIAVEVEHTIADGTGMITLLMAIVTRYLHLNGCAIEAFGSVKAAGEPVHAEEMSNAYETFSTKEKLPVVTRGKAYPLPLTGEGDYLQHLFGLLPVEDLKICAKRNNLTITEYLAAVLIYSIIKNAKEPIAEPISLAIPLNMRKYFPTETLRNFSAEMPLCFHPNGRTDIEFSEICKEIQGQLKEKITKENVQAFINSKHALVKNPVIRILPNVIKRPGLRAIQKNEHRTKMTSMFSNLGNYSLPAEMAERIERLGFVGGDPRPFGLSMFFGGVSFNGYMNVTFSIINRDVSLIKEFFRFLSADGVRVRIETT